MIRTKDELLTNFRSISGDELSDDILSFLDDVSDTIDNYETLTHDNENWHDKYNELDNTWRERYRDRFYNNDVDDNFITPEETEPEKRKPMTFEDLFN